jgi:PKD repeat protein
MAPGRHLLLGAALGLVAACGRNEPPHPSVGNEPPVAFAIVPATAFPGEILTFDGSGSSDPDGRITAWHWTFGDGTEREGEVVTHAYTATGTYAVRLTVTDNWNATDRDDAIVRVVEPEPLPAIDGPETARVLESVTFDGSGSVSPDPIVAWRWRLGDGTEAEGPEVTHAYARTGRFTVRLTVEDAEGRTAQLNHAIEILAADVSGTFDLEVAPAIYPCGSGGNGYDATFEDTALVLVVEDDGEATAEGTETGRTFAGALDGASLTLSGQYLAPAGSCNPVGAPVDATLSATFEDADRFEGTLSAYYDLGIGCQCSALFQITGTRAD